MESHIYIKRLNWYKSSIGSVCFREVLVIESLVNVKMYYQGNILLEEKKFKWREIVEPKFRRGFTFKEAMELIEK